MHRPVKGIVFHKERKSSVIYVAGGWTPTLVDSVMPPPHSSRFRVFFATTATASHHAGSEWINYPETTPRQWIDAELQDYHRVQSIVFDKQ